jgi:glutamate synthase domain-containing protein 2
MRRIFPILAIASLAFAGALTWKWPSAAWLFAVIVPVVLLGVRDMTQTSHAVLRNFPLIGHFRYLLEMIRPEINQYFIESNTDGRPFSREQRSLVYQRAKHELDTLPFGTQRDTGAIGYEWMAHSMVARPSTHPAPRIRIGGSACTQPYDASLLNISAMSYGSLSRNAIRALNGGAKAGGFAHNTGEGGISPYHLEPGGDLIWQIGTGYFGCRMPDGDFDPEAFAERAALPVVKMIEIKISQGAKPGHGGILPAKKVTPEIAEIRRVPLGADVLSPPGHRTFSTPIGLLKFVARLRELSNGKPVGFKLCVGSRYQFAAVCKAMLETGIKPDFITVDGGEGGTGAAPLEFSNAMGMPLLDGLATVHNMLVGFDLRSEIKLIASGKITTGFDMANRLAAGADLCNSARGMMFALGCIQALRCNANDCPTGVATQKPHLVAGLVVEDKVKRVHRYHEATVESLLELLGAAGIEHPDDLRPWHINRRVTATEVQTYADIYHYIEPGCLMSSPCPEGYDRILRAARADSFEVAPGS